MKSILTTLVICLFAHTLIAQNWNPRHPGWTDSFAANGFCWCSSTNFDHNLDSKTLRINGTNYNIVDVCDELKKHPSYRAFKNGDAPYNDIQCGNGPANDAPDEAGCPGRTDLGPSGCNQIGPTFDVNWLASRARFNGSTNPNPPNTNGTIVHIKKRNAQNFAIDGDNGGANGQNVYLWGANQNNANQQWVEIDRGNGYYSYQKRGTNFCIDGNRNGANRQNVYLWQCSSNNQNQHWQKVATSGGAYKLIKRNATGYALNGGSNGKNGQNVNLYDSSRTSQNLQWIITPIDASAKSTNDVELTDEIVLYPNPVNATTTIRNAANSIITIYDIKGSIILNQIISNNNEIINLSAVNSGIYYGKIRNDVTSTTLKIVKN